MLSPQIVLSTFLLLTALSHVKAEECASCIDVQPDGDFSCLQQKLWKKCTEAWMVDGKYCEKTCNRCSCTDDDDNTGTDTTTTTTTATKPASKNTPSKPKTVKETDSKDNVQENTPQNPKKTTNNIHKLQELEDKIKNQQAPEIEENENVDDQIIEVDQNVEASDDQLAAPIVEEEIVEQQAQIVGDGVDEKETGDLEAAAQLLAQAGKQVDNAEKAKSDESVAEPIYEVEEAAVVTAPEPAPVPKEISTTPNVKEIKSVSVADKSEEAIAEFRRPSEDNPLLDISQECTPLSAILEGTPGLQQFYRLLNLVDYGVDEIGSDFTLFAPIDTAVSQFLRQHSLKIDDLDKYDPLQLSSLKSKFQPIVRYHFVDSTVTSGAVQMLNSLRLETRFSGKLLYVRSLDGGSGGFELIDGQGDKCQVMIQDLAACEGIVHMVGCMLVPDL